MSGISQSSSPRSAASIAAAIVSGGATTDNAAARFDGVGGMLQNSSVIIADNGNVSVTTATNINLGYTATVSAAGTGAAAINACINDAGNGIYLSSFSSTYSGSALGSVRAGATELITIGATTVALKIGNNTSGIPIKFGIGSAEVVEITSTGSNLATSALTVKATLAATSVSAAAFVCNGGAGVAGAAYIGGVLNVAGNISLTANEMRTTSTAPQTYWKESDGSADNKTWAVVVNGEVWKLRIFNDAEGVASDVFSVTRSTTTVGTITIGGATTQATNWAQTGATTISTGTGAISLNGATTVVSGKQFNAADTTDSSSSTTGAIITAGGAGIAKALFVGGTSLTLTNATSLINLNRATDGNPGKITFTNAGGTKYNWLVAAQYNSDNAFEITPSTAAGGSTYSTAAISIAAATGLVSMAGALTVTGNATLNGPAFAVNATSAAGITITSATTNAVVNVLDARVNSSGTAAAGFGAGFTMRAESTTTDNTIQFELDSVWVVATHASRTSRALFYSQDSGGSRECMRIEASGTAAMIGFLGAAAVVRPATSGEATGFTAGAGTTATHLSTWTGNTGSTAYTTNDIVKHLKNLGLIAA